MFDLHDQWEGSRPRCLVILLTPAREGASQSFLTPTCLPGCLLASRTRTPRAQRTPPSSRNKPHQQLKRQQRAGCDQVLRAGRGVGCTQAGAGSHQPRRRAESPGAMPTLETPPPCGDLGPPGRPHPRRPDGHRPPAPPSPGKRPATNTGLQPGRLPPQRPALPFRLRLLSQRRPAYAFHQAVSTEHLSSPSSL